ncbi:MAG: hypothetical protein ACM336_21435 [Acidobacteriota bacterium]
MFRNFSLRLAARLVLGALVAANLIAALIAFKPWSGSAEDLERQAASLRSEVRKKQAALEKLSSIVSKVQTARTDGDKFMGGYLLNTRSVSSRLAGDLDRMAATASIRQKEVAFAFEPVEGSEGTLTKATMTANYEGTYADLIQFLNLLDRSPRLIILESLQATPQPQGLVLNITMKLNAFVREGEPSPEEMAARKAEDEAPQAAAAASAPAPAPEAQLAQPAPAVLPPPPPTGPRLVRQPVRPVRIPRTAERSAE